MEFINLFESLYAIEARVSVPKVGEFSDEIKSSEAAGLLHQTLSNAVDGRPRWVEENKISGKPIFNDTAVYPEAMAILEHAAGYYRRSANNRSNHIYSCLRAGLDPSAVPIGYNMADMQYPRDKIIRPLSIGFDRAELVAFLDENQIEHNLMTQAKPIDRTPRHVSHDETVVETLKADPDFANEYLTTTLEEVELPGGQAAVLAALRHIKEAYDGTRRPAPLLLGEVFSEEARKLTRLSKYLKHKTWPILWAALLVCGIQPPKGCTQTPEGQIKTPEGVPEGYWSLGGGWLTPKSIPIQNAIDVLCLWNNQENAPAKVRPADFVAWCKNENINTDWLRDVPIATLPVVDIVETAPVATSEPQAAPIAAAVCASDEGGLGKILEACVMVGLRIRVAQAEATNNLENSPAAIKLLNRLAELEAKKNQAPAPQAITPSPTPETPAPPDVAVGASGGVVTEKAGPVNRGWVMKKAALIDKHTYQWATIKGDFHSASENGLSKAAKAPGHGDWFEADALKWAEQRGKLKKEEEQGPATVGTVWTGRKHTLRG
jgi:hypothetical protein